jgi:hypothetical protein
MVKILQFVLYYLKKRVSVIFGLYQTRNPLDIRWRWNYWINNYKEIRKKAKRKTNVSSSKLSSSR